MSRPIRRIRIDVVGFDVEIAALIAARPRPHAAFVNITFTSIDQTIARGDADIGLSGIEDTPARRATLAVTIPYYEFREVLSVRDADAARFASLADLRGKTRRARSPARSPTTSCCAPSASTASRSCRTTTTCIRTAIWCSAASTPCCSTTCSPSAATARCADSPSSRRRSRSATTSACSRRRTRRCATASTRSCAAAMRDGTLERIFRKWHVWNDDQPTLYARLLAGEPVAGGRRPRRVGAASATMSRWEAARRYLPSLLRASVVTIVLSCLSMALAVGLGVLIATGRVYGGRAARVALTGYVELIRGTPILLQLFVLYYGLAAAIRLPAFVAALLGLALNYAAYESEIYRSALEAMSIGQLEAARTLGLSERQVLTLVRGAAGVPARARADDERLRRAAEGLVARLGAHRARADEADADLRDQSRQLGDSRHAVRGAVSRDVAAARRAGAAARTAVEDGAAMSLPTPVRCVARSPICTCGAARGRFSTGVSLEVARGELVAIMGPSGSGKTTILRAIAGLEPFEAGRIAVDGVTLTGGARRAAADAARAAAQGRHGLPVPLPVRAPVGDRERLPRAGARARRRAGRRASGARASCCGVRRRASRRRRCRASCRAARRSASRSRARWRSIRRCC